MAVKSVSGKKNWRWRISNFQNRRSHAWLSWGNTAAGPRPPLPRARLSVYVGCLHPYMYLRHSCDVCVPCVQPAGTVWGLFLSGPAESWGESGRMGLPRRPRRVWRSFPVFHNQGNLQKDMVTFSVKLRTNVQCERFTCAASKSTRWEESTCGPAVKSSPGPPSLLVAFKQERLALA